MKHASAQSHSGEVDPLLGPGMVLRGRYRLTRVLEVEPLATTYQAEEIDAQRSVTVKIFHELGRHDRSLRDRIQSPTSRGASPPDLPRFFLPVYDCDLGDDGRLFLVTDFVEGDTLADFVQKTPGLESGRLLELAIRIGEALEVALNLGLVELPLAPDNVIVEEGDRPRLRRSEFTAIRRLGLADKLREMETPAASLRYASPEELAGLPPTERSVIYRFGVLIYELLSGIPPFNGTTVAELRQQIRRGPERLRTRQRAIPLGLSRLVARMMSFDPLHRPADLTPILNGLWEALCLEPPVAEGMRHGSSSAGREGSGSAPFSRRFRWTLAAVTLGSVTLAMFAGSHLQPGRPPGNAVPPAQSVQTTVPAAPEGATQPQDSLLPSPSTSIEQDVESRTTAVGANARPASPRPSSPGAHPVAPARERPMQSGPSDDSAVTPTKVPPSIESVVAQPPIRPTQPSAQDARSANPVGSRTTATGANARTVSPPPPIPGAHPVVPALQRPMRSGPSDDGAAVTPMPPTTVPSSSESVVAQPPIRRTLPSAQDALVADPGAIIDWLMRERPRIGDDQPIGPSP